MASRVAVLFTTPETVLADYQKVMELASWTETLTGERELLLKLNLSCFWRGTTRPKHYFRSKTKRW